MHVGSPNVTAPDRVPIKTWFDAVVIDELEVTKTYGLPQDGAQVVPVQLSDCPELADCWAIPSGLPLEPLPVKVEFVETVPLPPPPPPVLQFRHRQTPPR